MNLVEVEAIKQLKARYFRYMDTKQWDKWGMVFTDDATLHNLINRPEPLRGRAEIVRVVGGKLADMVSVHHGHMPEIRLTGERDADGIWAMYDRLMMHKTPSGQGSSLVGYGHYIEKYRKEDDGQWRIARLELRRLHLNQVTHQRNSDVAAFPY